MRQGPRETSLGRLLAAQAHSWALGEKAQRLIEASRAVVAQRRADRHSRYAARTNRRHPR